ncbi:MAG: arsenic efflux protein, partial [Oscillospiraceae bacterium]|nr:arsenic efflux protein [Oscillospiraceae bacterium]
MIIDVIKDTLLDGVKLLPFLFLAYLLIEIIEDRSEERAVALVRKAGRLGPVLGGTVGVIPQCGFSAAMSNLYSTGLITRGTLLAVFLSTSDEMLPILISEKAEASFILKVLLFKLVAGVIVGVVADILFSKLAKGGEKHIHDMCEREGCKCEDGIMKSALFHTLKIFLFLLAVTFVLNLAVVQLYPVIEGLNLLLIMGISLALLLRKKANRVALYVMIGLCLVVLAFGAYSHIQYGRTIMATIAEQVLASNKVPDSKVAATFQKLTDAGEAPITVKTSDFDLKAEQKDFDGMPVLYVNGDTA